jgi:hypothetical protein
MKETVCMQMQPMEDQSSNKHAEYLSESTWHRDQPSFSSLFNFNPKDILNSAGQWTVKSVPSSLSGRPQNDCAEYVWLHFFSSEDDALWMHLQKRDNIT